SASASTVGCSTPPRRGSASQRTTCENAKARRSWAEPSTPSGRQIRRLTATASRPILLTDRLPQGVIPGYKKVRRIREIPVQRHWTVRRTTGQQAGRRTHDPKVGGSNPPPATNVTSR